MVGISDSFPLKAGVSRKSRHSTPTLESVGNAPENRISRIFGELRQEGRRAIIPFICGGHPQPGTTGLVLSALERAGAPIVEIGIPFSDPIADGPTIASAMHRALSKGATPKGVLDEVASLREWLKLGIVAMVSVSIANRLGGQSGERFVRMLVASGFDGVIYPDLPLEESPDWLKTAEDAGLATTMLIAPTTSPKRAEQIAKASSGFVYVVSRVGITGEQNEAPNVSGVVTRLRQVTALPIAAGFGISTAEHVRAAVRPGDATGADAAIVGSALVRRMTEAGDRGGDAVQAAEAFVAELARGLTGTWNDPSRAAPTVGSGSSQPTQQLA